MSISRKQPVRMAPRRVVVALRMAGIAGQDKLNGIFEHLSAGHRWQLIIYRTRHEFTAEVVRQELARKADGFIMGIPETDDALAVLAASRVPTVVMNVSGGGIEKRKDAIAFVKSDSAAVGREAAHTLLRQGVYKSYGYAGYRTDEPIAAITAACGWENPAPPKALFKRRFGMSMRDWRASVHK